MEVCRLQGDLPTDASRASCLTLTNGCDGPQVTGVIKGASPSESVNSRTQRGDGDEDDIEMGEEVIGVIFRRLACGNGLGDDAGPAGVS